MANKYESLRETVKLTIRETCVREAKDKSGVSYTWSIAHVFNAVGEACKMDSSVLPAELKDLVRFEFNKLRDSVLSGSQFTHKRSRFGYAFRDGSCEQTRNDYFINTSLPLSEQLAGMLILLDKNGVSLVKAKNAESKERLERRQRNMLKEITFLRNEIETQSKAIAEAQSAGTVTLEQQAQNSVNLSPSEKEVVG